MKTITATWFETKVKYNKTMENGLIKSVKEAYAVEALSFTEAEAVITQEMGAYARGEWDVVEEKIASYREVLLSEDAKDDTFYKVKLDFLILDEKTGKEKRQPIYYLVQASSVEGARKAMTDYFTNTTLFYEIVSVSKTALLDVFPHEAS